MPPGWVAPKIRWEGTFPPGFEGFGDDASWLPGPSIGLDKECVIYLARDAPSLMPPLSWAPLPHGVETADPRHGLKWGSQPVIALEQVGGGRVAVLNAVLLDVHGSSAYNFRVATDLASGRAIGLMLSWHAHSTVLHKPCGFGVSRESPRDVDVTFSPRNGAPARRTEGVQSWETRSIRWSPFVDPDRFTFEFVSIGPEPRVLVVASGAAPLLGDIDFASPLVPLDRQGEAEIYGTDISSYGSQAVWVESLGERERIRSYTQAGGIKVEIAEAPGFVRRVAFDGQRLSGTTQQRPLDFFESSSGIGLWTRDPHSGAVTVSPVFLKQKIAAAAKLKTADAWAVLHLTSGESKTDPVVGSITTAPMIADGSTELLLVVNLLTWAAYRVPLPPGRTVNNDGIGTDGTYAYVSLHDQGPKLIAFDELRRYPLARIAEWGTPWIAE